MKAPKHRGAGKSTLANEVLAVVGQRGVHGALDGGWYHHAQPLLTQARKDRLQRLHGGLSTKDLDRFLAARRRAGA